MTPARPASRGSYVFRPRRWALLLLVIAGLAVAADLFFPAGLFPPHEKRSILVERGQTLGAVSSELKRVGLLRGTLGFEVLARLMRIDRRIKAGQYSFEMGATVPELLRAFSRGMSGLNLVTIPEGLTLVEVASLLSRHLGVPIAAFDSLGHDKEFLDSLGVTAPSLEGYLAPNTYEFLPGTSPEVAFRTMVGRQKEILRRAAAGRDSLPLGLSLYKLLTLASIVESEAQVDDERPRIARVYLNRLETGMKLQADPTVAYGMGMRPQSRLFLRHLRFNSPFNTYMYQGLPPGPICNPGAKSIQGALNPSQDEGEFYFVARGQGRHFFSRTYEDHLDNIRRVRTVQSAAARTIADPESLRVVDSLAVKDSVAARATAALAGKPATSASAEAAKAKAASPEPRAGKPAGAPAKAATPGPRVGKPASTPTTKAPAASPKGGTGSGKTSSEAKKPPAKPGGLTP
jgi:UPF0755 protein